MDDDRVWAFEKSLWTGDAAHYHELIDEECLMVLPQPPFVYEAEDAKDAVSDTPRWDEVAFGDGRIMRPQEGLIVIAYNAKASRGEETYEANCTTTMRWLAHDKWRVVQHQQTPPLKTVAAAG